MPGSMRPFPHRMAGHCGSGAFRDLLAFPRQMAAVIIAGDNPEPGTIVDVGAGPGDFLAVMLEQFPLARGIWTDASEAMLDLAHERDITVLRTSGVQAEAHLAFAGLHQLVRPVRDRAANLPPPHRAALDAAFGIANDSPPGQFSIAMAVLDLLSDVAAQTPLLVTVDDAHRLDRPSAAVLAFVARRIESVTLSAYMIALPLMCRAARPTVWMSERSERRKPSLSASRIATSETSGMSSPSRNRLMPTSTSKSPRRNPRRISTRSRVSTSLCR